jgi:gamma-glutamylcyclotransferase (GGCT)/AIG2-like uncharacterized protein YtfP
MAQLIAVYGSLRYGGSANGLMRGCQYLGKDKIAGALYHLGYYPAFIPGEKSTVVVDIYKIPEEWVEVFLAEIDKYEGYVPDFPEQSLYNRVEIETVMGRKVWVYVYNGKVSETTRIKSGDWFDES